MAQTQDPAANPISGNVMFYSKPEPLDPKVHGDMGVNVTTNPFSFAAAAHVVPLTVPEFAAASLCYPVVFVGETKLPIAVMGLREGDNLFVGEGNFKPEAYVPAFIRRYPFVFAGDDANERFVLCVDTAAPFVSKGAQIPFFENGEPSAYTQNAMQFCNEFETERRRTQAFVDMLRELDLFEVREASFTPPPVNGQPQTPQKLADYFAVSEEKLRKLPDEKYLELRNNGALAQIYAHLHSLMGWDKLIALALVKAQEAAPAAGNA